ncbi:MAG TPA: pirin family protein [Marinilabiliaceae bacterium]|nr:pirin family protein [Marinilabiliaceae bacterium]
MEKNNRRNFLGKLGLGAAALVSAPVIGGISNTDKTNKKEMKIIKKVRALGFQWETMDPFLFCVHHEDKFPKGNDKMGPDASELVGRQLGQDFNIKDGWRMYHGKEVPGFPGHPHRGFETLTVVRDGMVDHSDSAGGAGRYGNGDLQWMTAGSGLLHSEMFPLIKKETENPLELFQIWLNLPQKSKMVTPDYKMFWDEDIPKFREGSADVEVLVGELFDRKSPTPPLASWANDPNNFVGVYNIELDENSTFILPAISEGINRTIFFYKGNDLEIEGQVIPEYHAIDVESSVELKMNSGNSKINFLVLQGRPINEPVVQHGPFVMNSRQEIQEAFSEYQRTQFGGWPWPKHEQVHDRDKGRFAIYSNGVEEFKS